MVMVDQKNFVENHKFIHTKRCDITKFLLDQFNYGFIVPFKIDLAVKWNSVKMYNNFFYKLTFFNI